MVSHLAERLVREFAKGAELLLDCFCGSGAVTLQGVRAGIPTVGLDINPYAILLTEVKLNGFDTRRADTLIERFIAIAKGTCTRVPIDDESKCFWFSDATIVKYERMRAAARELHLSGSPEGKVILLAMALSARLCSRADQRSPKPFISQRARATRAGHHFDPITQVGALYRSLRALYGDNLSTLGCAMRLDLVRDRMPREYHGQCSHLITSPPYINAQDYFRNCKLELFVLEGLLRFRISDFKNLFIGTERGVPRFDVPKDIHDFLSISMPLIERMKTTHPKQAAIVRKYFADMSKAIDNVTPLLKKSCTVVLVCGDNLVGGYAIPTWQLLNELMERKGFRLRETFGDVIACRNVAPQRMGHKGIIKREVVSSFKRG
jgi:hypothetical protein